LVCSQPPDPVTRDSWFGSPSRSRQEICTNHSKKHAELKTNTIAEGA
jgi:hypothetical protein